MPDLVIQHRRGRRREPAARDLVVVLSSSARPCPSSAAIVVRSICNRRAARPKSSVAAMVSGIVATGVTWPPTPTARNVTRGSRSFKQADRQERRPRVQPGPARAERDLQCRGIAQGPAGGERLVVQTLQRRRVPRLDLQPRVRQRLAADQGQLDLGVGQEHQVLTWVFHAPEPAIRRPGLADAHPGLGQRRPVHPLQSRGIEPVIAAGQLERRRGRLRRELVAEMTGLGLDHHRRRAWRRPRSAPGPPPSGGWPACPVSSGSSAARRGRRGPNGPPPYPSAGSRSGHPAAPARRAARRAGHERRGPSR